MSVLVSSNLSGGRAMGPKLSPRTIFISAPMKEVLILQRNCLWPLLHRNQNSLRPAKLPDPELCTSEVSFCLGTQ